MRDLAKGSLEIVDGLGELRRYILGQAAARGDALSDFRVGAAQVAQKLFLKGGAAFQRHVVGQAGVHRKENHHFLIQA